MGLLDQGVAYISHTVFRFLQFVMALTVCGLYGVDLNHARQKHAYSDSKWVFAEVVASLSAVTALFYFVPFARRVPWIFVWDTLLLFLWIVVFGIFGNLFIRENAEGDSGIQRMKNAVWVDLVNLLLWLISAVGMAVYWFKHKSGRSQWTGRATV